MTTFCKYLNADKLSRYARLAVILLCCTAFYHEAQADDLFFNPRQQREIDRRAAAERARRDSIRAVEQAVVAQQAAERAAAQRAMQQATLRGADDFDATWSDLDTAGGGVRGFRGIYSTSEERVPYGDEFEFERERESIADQLRFSDPTYVVLVRDVHVVDPWWGYGGWGAWGHPWRVGWGWNSWGWSGWGVGWGSPWGWGMGGWGHHYAWGGWGWYNPYWGYPSWGYHHHVAHRHVAYHQARPHSNATGTNSGTGFTNNRTSSNYSQRRMNMPATESNNVTRLPQQGTGSSTATTTTRRTAGGERVGTWDNTASSTNVGGASTQTQSGTSTTSRTSTSSSNQSSSFSTPSRSSSSTSSSSSFGSSSSSSRGGSSSGSFGSGGARSGTGR